MTQTYVQQKTDISIYRHYSVFVPLAETAIACPILEKIGLRRA